MPSHRFRNSLIICFLTCFWRFLRAEFGCATRTEKMGTIMSSFLLKEYTALEAEMNAAVKETRELERYALGVTGAVWAWVVGSGAGTANAFLERIMTHDWIK